MNEIEALSEELKRLHAIDAYDNLTLDVLRKIEDIHKVLKESVEMNAAGVLNKELERLHHTFNHMNEPSYEITGDLMSSDVWREMEFLHNELLEIAKREAE